MGSVFGVEAICKLITDVLPFIFKVTKNHSTAGRAKKAQELVDKTRAMLRSYWEQMTVAEREEFRDMLDKYISYSLSYRFYYVNRNLQPVSLNYNKY